MRNRIHLVVHYLTATAVLAFVATPIAPIGALGTTVHPLGAHHGLTAQHALVSRLVQHTAGAASIGEQALFSVAGPVVGPPMSAVQAAPAPPPPLPPPPPPVTDATSTSTADWGCIIQAESSGNFSDTSGGFGILVSSWWAYEKVWAPWGSYSVPGAAPSAVQSLVALAIFHDNGDRFSGSWNDSCTMGGPLTGA